MLKKRKARRGGFFFAPVVVLVDGDVVVELREGRLRVDQEQVRDPAVVQVDAERRDEHGQQLQRPVRSGAGSGRTTKHAGHTHKQDTRRSSGHTTRTRNRHAAAHTHTHVADGESVSKPLFGVPLHSCGGSLLLSGSGLWRKCASGDHCDGPLRTKALCMCVSCVCVCWF